MRESTTVCKAITKAGAPCRAPASYSGEYCIAHDPDHQAEAAAARSAGGRNRAKPEPAEPIALRTISDQIAAIEETIDRVRRGAEPVNVARLVLYGISLARPLVELEEIEKRLEALERGNA